MNMYSTKNINNFVDEVRENGIIFDHRAMLRIGKKYN